jgi:hypothetical protein
MRIRRFVIVLCTRDPFGMSLAQRPDIASHASIPRVCGAAQ